MSQRGNKIYRFFYSIFHAGALLRENEELAQKMAVANQQVTAANWQVDEIQEEKAQLKRDLQESLKREDSMNDRMQDLVYEMDRLSQSKNAYHSALKALLPSSADATQVDALFHAVAPHLDPEGWDLLQEGEKLLGRFQYSHFAYEDNRGMFEDADGYALLGYLEVSCAWRFGESNDRPRWDFVEGTCYERCTDFSIDETTPEYREYQLQLHKNFLITKGILPQREATPEQAQTNEGLS